MTTQEILKRAKKAVQELSLASNQTKNTALELMAECLLADKILSWSANRHSAINSKAVFLV